MNAKDLLERGPADDDEATEDNARVEKLAEALTLQRQRDVNTAASAGTVNAAVSLVLAACAIGAIVLSKRLSFSLKRLAFPLKRLFFRLKRLVFD